MDVGCGGSEVSIHPLKYAYLDIRDLLFDSFIVPLVVIGLNRAEKITLEQRVVAIKSAHILSIDFDSYLIA